MSDLRAFLATLGDDVSRLVFADWLDERYPATPVACGRLPPCFIRWWATVVPQMPLPLRMPPRRDRWSQGSVLGALCGVRPAGIQWLAHGGAGVIERVPVLISEPRLVESAALTAARLLQEAFSCPVSYSRQAEWSPRCTRIIVWYTFPTERTNAAAAPSPDSGSVPDDDRG